MIDAGRIENMIRQYKETGRTAHYYPRLNAISLNGGRRIPVEQAIVIMFDCITEERRKDTARVIKEIKQRTNAEREWRKNYSI